MTYYPPYKTSRKQFEAMNAARDARDLRNYTKLLQAYAGLTAGYRPIEVWRAMSECYGCQTHAVRAWFKNNADGANLGVIRSTMRRYWRPEYGPLVGE